MRIALIIVSLILSIVGIIFISQYEKGIEILSYIGMLSGGFTLAAFIWAGLENIFEWITTKIKEYRGIHNGKKK